jgi:Uma2 family endonuclease
MATPHTRQSFTVAEYHELAEQGVFGPTERVELIKGELIWMSPIGWAHADIVDELLDLLKDSIGRQWRVRSQNPVILGDHSEPQPDISVVERRRYRGSVPRANHARLVIEVADSTLFFDVNVKVPLYAAAGIPEAWVVEVRSESITQISWMGNIPGRIDTSAVARSRR